MHILVIDGGHVEAEFRAKFGAAHAYTFLTTDFDSPEEGRRRQQALQEAAQVAAVAFCCRVGYAPSFLDLTTLPVFVETSAASIVEMVSDSVFDAADRRHPGTFFGFCGLPTLLNRSLLEVSLYHEADGAQLAETCAALGTDYRMVADRVGLVTPRVICMIINEACFTVQEGTATMPDVDLGMKLGTNYPRGPFAWANAIGVGRVYAVLEALWHDTHDERYKVCPLLKRQALLNQAFSL